MILQHFIFLAFPSPVSPLLPTLICSFSHFSRHSQSLFSIAYILILPLSTCSSLLYTRVRRYHHCMKTVIGLSCSLNWITQCLHWSAAMPSSTPIHSPSHHSQLASPVDILSRLLSQPAVTTTYSKSILTLGTTVRTI